ncbi:hypothetical protein Pla52n_33780 [Stieleria varia]|uniref:DUF5658 domain-containing protein n=1 Tax=Stieleria varia TaxID=2528005 RepID=A0A5C6ARX7_9BACT|nr:hypothetical protein Pla52n_33780 [Stieleria varia]
MLTVRLALISTLGLLFPCPAAWAADSTSETASQARYSDIRTGFLFLDGDYVPMPYSIAVKDDQVIINGRELDLTKYDLSQYERPMQREGDFRFRPVANRGESMGGQGFGRQDFGKQGSGGGPSGGGGFRDGSFPGWQRRGRGEMPDSRSPAERFAMDIRTLNSDAVVLVEPGKSPRTLWTSDSGSDFLAALASHGDGMHAEADLPEALSAVINEQDWGRYVQSYFRDSQLRERISEWADRVQQAVVQSDRHDRFTVWRERLAFPITLFAYVMVVFAIGHLMTHAPQMVGNDHREALSNMKQISIKTLLIVASLSAIDLIWTLLASESGSMKELNPLGRGLIENPMHLMIFKISVTAMSIVLLYRLHDQPLARRATWWSCLVLTLLTARWLTFQSMFV